MTLVRTAAAAAALALSLSACGPSSFSDVAEQAVKDGLPGIAIYVQSGADNWTGVAGVADLRTGTKLKADDRFLLVGPTGLMVATAAMQLIEAGTLRLDDPVSANTGMDGIYGIPEINRIAIRNVLNHSTGLLDPYTQYAFLQRIVGTDAVVGNAYTPRDGVKELTTNGMRPLFRPGQGASYSAGNETLLGLAIEGTLKADLAHVLKDRIFTPSGMTSAHLAGFEAGGSIVPGYHQASPQLKYLGINSKLPDAKPGYSDMSALSPTWAWAAGGVAASVGDLGRFASALFGGKLVKPETLKMMQTFDGPMGTGPLGDSVEFGFGLLRKKVGGDEAVGFEGEALGYAAIVFQFSDGVTVAAVANGSGGKGGLNKVAASIHQLIKTSGGQKLFAPK